MLRFKVLGLLPAAPATNNLFQNLICKHGRSLGLALVFGLQKSQQDMQWTHLSFFKRTHTNHAEGAACFELGK